MSIPPDINAIFDIDEENDEVNMDISDSDIDNMLDSILDATNGVDHTWEEVEGDDTISESKRFKTYSLPVEEYIKWIKGLERQVSVTFVMTIETN